MPITPRSITARINRVARVILTPIRIYSPVSHQQFDSFGLWDTGATSSVITLPAVNALGLIANGKVNASGVHGIKEVNTHIINVNIMQDLKIDGLVVTECENLNIPNCCMLIGMDIISQGEMAITNFEGKTIFTFRIPSTKKIDFFEEDKFKLAILQKSQRNPGKPVRR